MKHNFCIPLILFLCLAGRIEAQIIPAPGFMEKHDGVFLLDAATRLYTNLTGEEKQMMLGYLKTFSTQMKEGKKSLTARVVKLIKTPLEGTTNKEAYELNVTPDQIVIKGITGSGLFYGLQTMMQLAAYDRASMSIPCVTIKDQPRFEYRGFELDVSRHFFPKEFILKMLDILSYYKINVFHFHLADMQGWRLELDGYPELTEMTAYRPAENLDDWRRDYKNTFGKKEDKTAYGGYYTKQDIRDIVELATLRHITVIPEIDMPGHSADVLCAYPGLACEGLDYHTTGELCIGKEETFRFCEGVLKEVMELFPSELIHIGGDEANRRHWEACPLCQKRMKEEHLKNGADLQGYFTNRIEKFVNAHGRRIIGWDEILDANVPKRVVVMSWREEIDGTGEALKRGHQVIMSPTDHCYLDYYQDIPYTQPLTFGYNSLEKTYSLEPSAEAMQDSAMILGVQGNLWTERVSTPAHAEYMAFPRMLAIAEIGWTRRDLRSYPEFRERALHAVEYLKQRGLHPFELKNEFGSRPASKNNVTHLALGKKVTYLKPYNTIDMFGSREKTFTDGVLGDWGLYGPRWQGCNADMDVIIDLDSVQDIHSIEASFMQVTPAGGYSPSKLEIFISEDGENYTQVYDRSYKYDPDVAFYIFNRGWKGKQKARYIHFHAYRPEKWGHVLCDEIIVR